MDAKKKENSKTVEILSEVVSSPESIWLQNLYWNANENIIDIINIQ